MAVDGSVFGTEESKKVTELWNVVFSGSNKVLQQHSKYGFDGFEQVPHPNVHDMLVQLKLFNAVFDVLLNADLGYDNNRLLLNAKAQVTNMEGLALALEAKNREDYEAAVKAIESQAVF